MWDALWNIAFGKLGLDTETCSYSPQVNVGCVPKKVRVFCHRLPWLGLGLVWVPAKFQGAAGTGCGEEAGPLRVLSHRDAVGSPVSRGCSGQR